MQFCGKKVSIEKNQKNRPVCKKTKKNPKKLKLKNPKKTKKNFKKS